MKKFILFIVLLLVVRSTIAQIAISGDAIHGTPIYAKINENIKGSPYLFDQWFNGSVKLKDKTVHNDMQLKYDQMTGKLIFKDKSENTFHFEHPVEEFTLQTPSGENVVFKNGFKNIEKNTDDTFYQILADGKVKLLKHSKKSIVQSVPYGQSVPEKTILNSEAFYVVSSDTIQKLKKDKKALAFLNSDKLSSFITKNNMDLQKEADLILAINFYNSL